MQLTGKMIGDRSHKLCRSCPLAISSSHHPVTTQSPASHVLSLTCRMSALEGKCDKANFPFSCPKSEFLRAHLVTSRYLNSGLSAEYVSGISTCHAWDTLHVTILSALPGILFSAPWILMISTPWRLKFHYHPHLLDSLSFLFSFFAFSALLFDALLFDPLLAKALYFPS